MAVATDYEQAGELKIGQVGIANLRIRTLDPARLALAAATDQQALAGRELVTVARYIGQSGDSERTRPFLLRLAGVTTF